MDNLEANLMDKSMRSVFVGNIPYEATEEKLKDIFSEVGQVLNFKFVFDRDTGKPKGYGFCEYKDQETALSAMRNLNGYEIGGRNLRVDNACTEKSRMEMQNLLNQSPVDSPYGDPVEPDKAPEAICKAVACLPPEQMLELVTQMKTTIEKNPLEARQMLLKNPQLAYALLQIQTMMNIIEPQTARTLLQKQNPSSSKSSDRNLPKVPISASYLPPKEEFLPMPLPRVFLNQQPAAFPNQDVDLRSLNPRNSRIGDQDMRTLPGQLPNPLPPPISESINRDSRSNFFNDPRLLRTDSREENGDMAKRVKTETPKKWSAPTTTTAGVTTTNKRLSDEPVVHTSNVPPQPPQLVTMPQKPVLVPPPPQPPAGVPPTPMALRPGIAPNFGHLAGGTDQEKAALIMQVLQLSDEQVAMLPPEQRNSILLLKEQIAKSAQQT